MNPLQDSSSSEELFAALFGLDGQTAVVTGAAAGLGREIATGLAIAGASVALADIDLEAAEIASAAVRSRGHRAQAFEADITSERSVVDLFERVSTDVGPPSILVNNAGIYPLTPLVDMTVEEWDRVQHINLRGAFLCTREAVRRMRRAGQGGRVINISSMAAVHPALDGQTHYAASKAGLVGLTMTSAHETAADGININVILPGGVLTETRATSSGDPSWTGPAADIARFLLGPAPPWKHVVPVLFLAGPGAAHMTGQSMIVDGGFQLS
jgi:NAD(P)-dependent dehydrogenase (short-subunit alcohol dehydrogenase family)